MEYCHLCFFNVYMDSLSDILCKTECGCTMGGRMINHLMYVDDVVILSPSAKGLQRLINICAAYGDSHDITFNHAKTVCMYVFAIERQLYIELATYLLELSTFVFSSEV